MKILEEYTIQNQKYICTQKVSIDSKIIYICKKIDSDEVIYLKQNEKGNLEETTDENIKDKIDKLLHARSEDVIY